MLFCIMPESVYIPTNSIQMFTSLPAFAIACLFGSTHPNRCEVASHVFLVYIFLMIYAEHFFMYLFVGHLHAFFGKICIQVLFPFFLMFCLFFGVLSGMSSLYILDINPLSDMWVANTFSHSKHCLFIFLMASFAEQTLFFI